MLSSERIRLGLKICIKLGKVPIILSEGYLFMKLSISLVDIVLHAMTTDLALLIENFDKIFEPILTNSDLFFLP